MTERRILLAIGLMALAGCGRRAGEESVDAAQREPRPVTSPMTNGEMPVGVRAGEKTPETARKQAKSLPVPPDFPNDVYVYEDGVIEIAESVEKGFSLSIRTSGPEEKIAASYIEEMTGRGWVHLSGESPSLLMFTKDERVATVACLLIGDSVMVGVTISKM